MGPPAHSQQDVSRMHATVQDRWQGPDDSPMSMPSDCAVGPQGDLYVLDGVHNRVVVFDPNGHVRIIFGREGAALGELRFPLGLTAAPDGKIYIADSGNHRFETFTADGSALRAVDLPRLPDAPADPDPTDVSLDPTGTRLYIVDNDNHRLHLYSLLTDSFVGVWGEPGQGRRQFRYPFLMDTTDQGYLLIVEPINTRVQVLNAQGKFVGFIGAWGVKAGQLFRPKGVVSLKGTIFVTDSYLGRVQMFDIRGQFLGLLCDPQGQPLTLTTPTGIAADAQRRRLYVVELKADRVCRLDLE